MSWLDRLGDVREVFAPDARVIPEHISLFRSNPVMIPRVSLRRPDGNGVEQWAGPLLVPRSCDEL
jgi:hypothetical protein